MEFWFEVLKFAFILTYICWGIVISIETNLAMNNNSFAIKWVKERYKLKRFMVEVYAFYPIVLLGYLFLEIIPYYLGFSNHLTKFNISQAIYNIFYSEIDEGDLK